MFNHLAAFQALKWAKPTLLGSLKFFPDALEPCYLLASYMWGHGTYWSPYISKYIKNFEKNQDFLQIQPVFEKF